MLLQALPLIVRRRTAIAASSNDIFRNPVRGFSVRVLANAFPFHQSGSGVRRSLEQAVRLLRDDWNVIVLPEGRRSPSGAMQPFKGGIGWLVNRTAAEVLPIRVDVLRPGLLDGGWFPNPRGRVRVTVGAPIRLEAGLSYEAVAQLLEDAVRSA
jgi:1-acyl-sn-glycerol-3-phosphate acyltransferase